jgi:hypothetical protein
VFGGSDDITAHICAEQAAQNQAVIEHLNAYEIARQGYDAQGISHCHSQILKAFCYTRKSSINQVSLNNASRDRHAALIALFWRPIKSEGP